MNKAEDAGRALRVAVAAAIQAYPHALYHHGEARSLHNALRAALAAFDRDIARQPHAAAERGEGDA